MPIYPKFFAWPSTVKARLLKASYVPNYGSDRYLSDVSSHFSTGTNVGALTVSGLSDDWNEPVLVSDCDNLEWTNATCTDFSWIAIYGDTGSAATSPLVMLLDVRKPDGSTNTVSTGTITYVFDEIGSRRSAWA